MTTSAPTSGPTAAEVYVEAVAKALAGVPEQERTDLLEDLAGHLAELEAEDGEALESHLGPPEAYAAELLSSAGIEVPVAKGDRSIRSLIGGWADAARTQASSPLGRSARAFAVELRPGWWVARAWLAMALLTIVGTEESVYPLPDLWASDLLSFATLLAAVVLSVRVGRLRGRLDRIATVVGVVGLLWALNDAGNEGNVVYYQDSGSASSGVLVSPDGRTITNIWPFDGQGRPLDGVVLFDQDGNPIQVGPQDVFTGDPSPYGATSTVPRHLAIPGLFPQAQQVYEYHEATGTERMVPAEAPAVSIPQLPEGTASSTTVPADASTTTTPPAAGAEATSTTTAAPPG